MNEVAEAVTPEETGQATEQAPQPTEVPKSWKDDLPEEIRNAPSLQTIEDVNSLAKGFVHAQRMVGADKVALLGKSATEEEYNDFYKKIGRPDNATDYQFEIDENATVPNETVTGMSNVFHKAGLTQRQANILMNEFIDSGMGDNPTLATPDERMIAQIRQDNIGALQKEWGNKYDDNLAMANAVMMEFGDIDMREKKQGDGTTLGDNVDVIRLLANVGEFINSRVSEDKLEGTKMAGGASVESAKQKVLELKKPDSPFWDAKHPEHDWYVQEAFKYQQIVDGI